MLMRRIILALLAVDFMLGAAVAHATTAHRNPPPVPNVGGFSKPLRIVGLIPSDYANASEIADFLRAAPTSQWFAAVQAAYPTRGQAPVNFTAKVLLVDNMPDMLTQSRTVASYQDYVYSTVLAQGVGKDSSHQTIYVLFIRCAPPHGMDSFGCVSHHPAIAPGQPLGNAPESNLFSQGDSMAVVLQELSQLDAASTVASHEVAEAYTDTLGVGQWRLHSSYPGDPWMDAPPWVRAIGTIELADMAQGTRWFETDPASHQTFCYQRIYCTGCSSAGDDDYATPAQSNPVYGVSTALGNAPHDWHSFDSGATVSIRVTAWAEAGVGSFSVSAMVQTAGGALAMPCTLPQTTWTVQDGDTFDLVVDVPRITDPQQHVWCTIELDAARPTPPADDDLKHFWMAGVIVVGHP
jgi:hypothetical protein